MRRFGDVAIQEKLREDRRDAQRTSKPINGGGIVRQEVPDLGGMTGRLIHGKINV
jgi:hypothetical protein